MAPSKIRTYVRTYIDLMLTLATLCVGPYIASVDITMDIVRVNGLMLKCTLWQAAIMYVHGVMLVDGCTYTLI